MTTRRDFLKRLGSVGIALASTPILSNLEAIANPQLTHNSSIYNGSKPQVVAEILKEMGFKPDIHDYNGDKTLILAAEIHLGLGRFYVDFMKRLKQRLKVSGAYLEGVLSENTEPDSYLAALAIAGLEKDELDGAKKRDASGYYGLKEAGMDVRGLEELRLWQDKKTMSRIVDLVYSSGIARKDEKTLKELDGLIKSLRIVNFPFDVADFKIFDRYEMWKKVLKVDNHVALKMRNQSWAEIIDKSMSPNSCYFGVVGEDHFYTPKIQADFETGHGNLQEELEKRKINAIAIQGNEVIEFYIRKNGNK